MTKNFLNECREKKLKGFNKHLDDSPRNGSTHDNEGNKTKVILQ